ncbi:hypothetical protein ACHAWF_012465 [Thalassiosira exigua]
MPSALTDLGSLGTMSRGLRHLRGRRDVHRPQERNGVHAEVRDFVVPGQRGRGDGVEARFGDEACRGKGGAEGVEGEDGRIGMGRGRAAPADRQRWHTPWLPVDRPQGPDLLPRRGLSGSRAARLADPSPAVRGVQLLRGNSGGRHLGRRDRAVLLPPRERGRVCGGNSVPRRGGTGGRVEDERDGQPPLGRHGRHGLRHGWTTAARAPDRRAGPSVLPPDVGVGGADAGVSQSFHCVARGRGRRGGISHDPSDGSTAEQPRGGGHLRRGEWRRRGRGRGRTGAAGRAGGLRERDDEAVGFARYRKENWMGTITCRALRSCRQILSIIAN